MCVLDADYLVLPPLNYQVQASDEIKKQKQQEARQNWKQQATVPMFFSTYFCKLMHYRCLKVSEI